MSRRLCCTIGLVALMAGCTKSTDEAALLNPDQAASRGYDAFNQGDYQGARTHFEAALAVDPNNPYALLGMETIGEDIGQEVGTIQTIHASPEETRAFTANYQGRNAYETGDLAGAEIHFLDALDAEPDNAYAFLGLASVYELAGEEDAANRFYEKARLSSSAADSGTYTALTRQRQDQAQIAVLAAEGLERMAPLYIDRADEPALASEAFTAPVQTIEARPVDDPPSDTQGQYRPVGSYEDYMASQASSPQNDIITALDTPLDAGSADGSLVYAIAGSRVELTPLETDLPPVGQIVYSSID